MVSRHLKNFAGSRIALQWLLAAVFLTVALRLPALTRPLYIDESPILRNVAHLLSNRTILPEHFSYPPLFSYLAVPLTGIVSLLGGLLTWLPPSEWALLESAFGARWLVQGGRLLSVFFTALAAMVIWKATEGISLRCRMLGIAVFAFSPEAIRYGAMALPDIGSAVGAACALYFATRYYMGAKDGVPPLRMMIFAGVALGIGAAFKYNSGLAVVGVMVAALMVPEKGRGFLHLCLAGLAALATFLFLAPTWLLLPAEAWEGFLFESRNVRTPRYSEPGGTPFTWLAQIGFSETGWLLAALLGIIALGKTRDVGLLIWTAPLVLNGAIVSTWGKQDANYLLPTMAIAGVALARAVPLLGLGRRHHPAVLGVVLLVGLVVERPFPPWAEDLVRESMQWHGSLSYMPSQAISPSYLFPEEGGGPQPLLEQNSEPLFIRFGLHTPKIWSAREVAAFREGRGSGLSERGEEIFIRRLSQFPTTHGRVLVLQDDLEEVEREILINRNRYVTVIATDLYVQRYLKPPVEGTSAEDLLQHRLVTTLEKSGAWDGMLSTERGGEGWAYVGGMAGTLFLGESGGQTP